MLIVPREMMTTGPAPGLAHGIGASAVPRVDNSGRLIEEPARNIRRKKPRVVTAGPPLRSQREAVMGDDVPEVTEWTENGLPQRRSRVTMTLKERYAREAEAQRIAEIARRRDRARPPAPKKQTTEPGLWVEAFMKGVKGEGAGGPDPSAPQGTTPPQGTTSPPGTTPPQGTTQNNHGNADEGGWQ